MVTTILIIILLLTLWVTYDVLQKKHAILRNFPIIGHFRYWLEKIGPELRQYIVTSNNEERPFSRNERRWIYASSKQENDMFGFGTDNNIEAAGHPIIKPAMFPIPAPNPGDVGGPPDYSLPCAKILGESHNRAKAFRPSSIVNISGMSYGALSGPAIEALNKGAQLSNCMHNTGEGGLSRFHQCGGDVIFQIGTGYFGCRDNAGQFSLAKLVKLVEDNPQIKAIEIKLSQGAKPGLGGTLPGVKVTEDIAAARGIEVGVTCKSPNNHTAFTTMQEMVDFIEEIANITGLPVGIKSAVGELSVWQELAQIMAKTNRGPDFITIDGGEGGTGAAPLAYTDHMALPFNIGFPRVFRVFAKEGLAEDIVWIGAGRLGLPYRAILAIALGCDMVNVGREAMLSVGCIQAQACHTNHCPTGVATNNKWLTRGLDPTLKSVRSANYIKALRRELLSISRSCGVIHPSLLQLKQLEIVQDKLRSAPATDAYEYEEGWGMPSAKDQALVIALMNQLEAENTSLTDTTQTPDTPADASTGYQESNTGEVES